MWPTYLIYSRIPQNVSSLQGKEHENMVSHPDRPAKWKIKGNLLSPPTFKT